MIIYFSKLFRPLQQPHFPAYTASLHLELYKSHDKDYYIQLFYRSDGEENPSALDIPHCGKKCDFDKFYELYRDIIPDDFESECRVDDDRLFDYIDDIDEIDEDDY